MQDCYTYPEPCRTATHTQNHAGLLHIQNNHKRVQETIQTKFTARSHIYSVAPNISPFNKEQTVSVSTWVLKHWFLHAGSETLVLKHWFLHAGSETMVPKHGF
jgi:hypothetical protein